MKIIQSFWTRPRRPEPDDLVRWALSVTLAKKHFGRVELHTDSVGKELLVDRLRLPYDEVYLTLDKISEDIKIDFWAFGKLLAYQAAAKQGEPFLHIDDDVFLFKPFRKEILEAPIVAQCVEPFCYYRSSLKMLPPRMRNRVLPESSWRAYNLGVVGGSDTQFLGRYADRAVRFAEELSQLRESTGWHNTVFEQAMFGKVVFDERRVVTCVLKGGYNNQQAESIGFTHLMQAKGFPGIGARVARTLAAVSGGTTSVHEILGDQKSPPVFEQLHSVRVTGFPSAANCNYNGGIFRWNGQDHFVYRTHRPIHDCRHELSPSTVWISSIDTATGVTTGHRRLEITIPGYDHIEDPRPLVLGGVPHVAVTASRYAGRCFCTQALVRMTSDLAPEAVVQLPTRTKTEKNWQFFEYDGNTYFVYDPVGHEVSSIDGDRVFLTPGIKWRFGRPAGGTPPVQIGDHFYSFFHSHTFHTRHNRVYHFGCYRFRARPPFAPDMVSRAPIASGSEDDGRIGIEGRMHWHPLVVFPVSARFVDGTWLVSFGINDSFSGLATIKHDDVLAGMGCLKSIS